MRPWRIRPYGEGLTALCKAKPSADKYEVIAWLADWLLQNNPAKPRGLAPFEGDEDAFLADEEEENEEDALLFEQTQDLPAARVRSDSADPAHLCAEGHEVPSYVRRPACSEPLASMGEHHDRRLAREPPRLAGAPPITDRVAKDRHAAAAKAGG